MHKAKWGNTCSLCSCLQHLDLVIQLKKLHGILRKAEITTALCMVAHHGRWHLPCNARATVIYRSTALLFANTPDATGQSTVSISTRADHLEIKSESTASRDYWTRQSMKGSFVPPATWFCHDPSCVLKTKPKKATRLHVNSFVSKARHLILQRLQN